MAREIEVNVEIKGNLDVDNVCALCKTSKLDGNVTYGTIVIERGASIVGNISVCSVTNGMKSNNLEEPIKKIKSV